MKFVIISLLKEEINIIIIIITGFVMMYATQVTYKQNVTNIN